MAYDQIKGAWDLGHLVNNFSGDVQVFFTDNNNPASGSQKWVKPSGASMCYMVVITGGGGGGGGRTRTSTNPGGGGGGGASGNIAKYLVPAIFIPDVLWVLVGSGGAGGAANGNGTIGLATDISYSAGISAISAIPNIILSSAGNNMAAATAGGTAAAGAGGTLGAVINAGNIGAAAANSIFSVLAGGAGTAGGVQTGAVGVDVTAVWNTVALSGGAGGAGVNTVNTGFAGGNIVLQSALDFADGTMTPASNYIAGGVAGSSTAAGDGNAGVQLWKPFYMTGGSGGGSSDGGIGGNGGNGGIGCGGGGGGAGTTGGRGGNGGNGFAIIISW
jgi:hypothetical protein